jgi:hypothetical protein
VGRWKSKSTHTPTSRPASSAFAPYSVDIGVRYAVAFSRATTIT